MSALRVDLNLDEEEALLAVGHFYGLKTPTRADLRIFISTEIETILADLYDDYCDAEEEE